MNNPLSTEHEVVDPMEFIRSKLATAEFFLFLAPEDEWTFVFHQISDKWFKDDDTVGRTSDFGVLYIPNAQPLWWIRIDRVDTAELGRLLGLKPSDLVTAAVTMLHLEEAWVGPEVLPKPNVQYYGEA